MNNGISKAQPRRSRVRLSKRLQEELLRAIATPSPSLAGADLPRHDPATPKKRQLDTADQPSVKKARRPNAYQPGIEGKGAQPVPTAEPGQAPVLQHPTPKRPYASFLDKFVDPVQLQPCSGTGHTEHSSVLQWLESVGSDRDTRCRSDSHLHRADDNPPLRQLTVRSDPAMSCTQDADAFTAPPRPASVGSRSLADTSGRLVTPSNVTGSSSGLAGRSLVENPSYRDTNLVANNIFMRPPYEELPEQIATIVNDMRKDRDSPGPSPEDVRRDHDLSALQWMGAGEPQVENYFRASIFPSPPTTERLKRSDRQPMAKHTVPSSGHSLKVSTPVPDMLYGYSQPNAFSPQQQAQLIAMGTEMVGNNQSRLLYPFFAVEFKGDGGNMWVAANQCLGASASCISIAETLNSRLKQCRSDVVHPIDTAAFSIAINGTEARLYISWKHNELDYYMTCVNAFLLQDPRHYIEFRKCVRNIIDWGGGGRLDGIRKSLDSLLEEGRKMASATAKSREPPSADPASGSDSGSGSNKSRKMPSTRPMNRGSMSGGSPGQSSAAEAPYWEWDVTIERWFHRNDDGTLSWAEKGE